MGKREEFGKIFIYFIFALWSGSEIILNSRLEKFLWLDVGELNNHMSYVILALLMVQIIFFQEYQIKELLLIGIISLPIIYATSCSNHNTMMSTWIFIIAVKYIDFERIVKLTYYVGLLATVLVILLFVMGYISEYTMYRGTILRHSLGFSHPNMLGVRIFLLVVCRCFIHKKNFNILDWGIIPIAAIFVYRVTNSQTSCIALVILAVIVGVYVIVDMYGGDFSVFSRCMIVVAIFANLLSLFLSFINLKKYPMLKRIDRFMSSRFSQCHRTLDYYGVKLFGQDIKLIFVRPGISKTYHFWLDNAYMSILLRYGIIVFAFFSVMYICTMIYLRKIEQHLLVAILCLYAVYGIMENNFFSMSQNLFLLLLSYPIYRYDDMKAKVRKKTSLRITW